jgi:methylenetetrahydrofolate dehydrogenase (NADP+) / methenyltetrahydrofolate cyclohydrolase
MTKIIDGKLVASKVLQKVKREVAALKRKKVQPRLAFILVGDSQASLAYIGQKIKACNTVGIEQEYIRMPARTSQKTLLKKIEELNKNKNYHGILVQLPLPGHLNAPDVIKAIDPYKDVDGFHAYNVGKLFISKNFEELVPCTPRGVVKLLEYYKVPLEGKRVVILGRSNIVGKPLAAMLINRSATVTLCNSHTKQLARHTQDADIVIVAVGRPKLLKGSMVKKGATVIDVGFNREKGKIVGDVDFVSVYKKAKLITPVPGGVGPMTVACLMQNVVSAARRLTS